MTAPLPPPFLACELNGSEQVWTRDLVKLAVRQALERAALYLINDCHDDMLREEEAAGIRAMIEEYKND